MNSITFGILTVSDTCYADNCKDASGPKAVRLVSDHSTETGGPLKGHVILTAIVPDEEPLIMKTLIEWSDKDKVNIIFTTGGTGFAERDVTPEATRRVIDREAPGISLAMLNKSLQITSMAMLSRAVCGIRNKTLIINMPGSPKAITECWNAVADVIPHAVALILGNKSKVSADHSAIQGAPNESLATSAKCKDLEKTLRDVANRLRKSAFPMIDLEVAEKIIEENCAPFSDDATGMGARVIVGIDRAHGRILATAVYSRCDLPPFRASIKDGYAMIATNGDKTLKVLGGVEAGHEPGSVRLTSGTCVRVNTGAPIPDEATAVVQVEDTTAPNSSLESITEEGEETYVKICVAPTEGQDIRPVGSDIKKGAMVLDAHTKLGAVELGILASCGVTTVEVTKVPIVGILSTGNELQSPGESLKPGQIYDSNKITLLTTLKESGFDSVDLGMLKDDVQAMIAGIEKSLNLVDVLITTGSVSMGDKDLLKPILKEIFNATIHFGRVNLKPGKPTTFATCEYRGKKKYLLCLPGNPVSATVTAHLFAIPLLRRLAMDYSKPQRIKAITMTEYNLDQRPEFARVILVWRPYDNVPEAFSTGNQISSKLLSCKSANALLMLPAKTDKKPKICRGTNVEAQLLGFETNPLIAMQEKIRAAE